MYHLIRQKRNIIHQKPQITLLSLFIVLLSSFSLLSFPILAQPIFSSSFEDFEIQEITLIDVQPQIEVPTNRLNVTPNDLLVSSFLSDTAQIVDSNDPTLLVAENNQGSSILLGFGSSQNLSPELSIRSTALALVMMIAASGLDSNARVQIEASILQHQNFSSLVTDIEATFTADPMFLDRLGTYSMLVAKIKQIAADAFNSYLASIDPERESKTPTSAKGAQESGKTFCKFTPGILCTSPWKEHEPWDWFGTANLANFLTPPFIAVPSEEPNRSTWIAAANPSMINYSMQLYDFEGNLLNWYVTPRNSTIVQKGLNSYAAYRDLRIATEFPSNVDHVEFHKYRFTFTTNDDGGVQVSLLNTMHLVSATISIASLTAAANIKDLSKFLAATPTAANAYGSCVFSLVNTVDYESGQGDEAILNFLVDNLTSIVETLFTSCLPILVSHYGRRALLERIAGNAISATGEILIKFSNPAGWAWVVANAVNEFVPVTSSYFGFNNNFVGYDIIWHEENGQRKYVNDVIENSKRPEPSGPGVTPPQAIFSAAQGSGLTVTFDASESVLDDNSNPAYEWGLGDGSLASGKIVEHTYATAGKKNIRLTVYDGLGNSDETIKTFIVKNGNSPMILAMSCAVDIANPRRINAKVTITDSDNDLASLDWYLYPEDSNPTISGLNQTNVALDYPDNGIDSFTPTVVVTDATGNQVARSCTEYSGNIDAGLVAYYPFDGNTRDVTGNSGEGEIYGAVLAEDRFEKPNRAYRFDGADDYIEVPYSELAFSDISSITQLTVAAWIKLEQNISNEQARIVNRQVTQAGTESWGLEIFGAGYGGSGPGNNLTMHTNGGSGGRNLISSTNLIPDVWYHVVGVNDGENLSLYINGQLDTSIESVGLVSANNTAPLTIGKTGPGNAFYFPGVIDDLRIYNKPLSSGEIEGLAK